MTARGPLTEADYRGQEPAEQTSVWRRVRRPLVAPAKSALRRWGIATAGRRCLPDYLIIGAKRAGSTTLARGLVAHDDVLRLFPPAADIKGTYFFDVHHDRGIEWYRSHFPTRAAMDATAARLNRRVVVGEASPWYLHHPHAAQRAHEVVPDAEIICLVRDPVDRARSHHRERVRQGIEPIPTLETALEAESERTDGEWQAMQRDPSYVSLMLLNHGYAAQSRYVPSLARWIERFGERVRIVESEDLFADPPRVMAQVRSRLGLTGPSNADVEHFNRLSDTSAERTSTSASPQDHDLRRYFHDEREELAQMLENHAIA